jgi:hypothetical protein
MQNPAQFTNPTRPTGPTDLADEPQAAPSSPAAPASPPPAGRPSPGGEPASRPRTIKLPGSAFSAAFLEKLRLVSRLAAAADDTSSTQAEALVAGPLAVERLPDGSTTGGLRWAVVRRDEPVADGGKAAALLHDRADALRAAAVLPAVAAPSPYRLKDKPTRLGIPLHCHRRHVGHVCRLSPERREVLLTHLHLVRHLAADPDALALVLEAAGPEALPVLGRALARRVEALLP